MTTYRIHLHDEPDGHSTLSFTPSDADDARPPREVVVPRGAGLADDGGEPVLVWDAGARQSTAEEVYALAGRDGFRFA